MARRSFHEGFDQDQAQVAKLTPENSGASQKAVNAAKRIIMLDGLMPVRNACHESGSYDVLAFAAELARIIDAETK